MGKHFHFQVEVARLASSWRRRSLAGQAELGPGLDPLGDLDLGFTPARQSEAPLAAENRLLKGDLEHCFGVRTSTRCPAGAGLARDFDRHGAGPLSAAILHRLRDRVRVWDMEGYGRMDNRLAPVLRAPPGARPPVPTATAPRP